MENKPRTQGDIETDYDYHHGIAASMSDMLFFCVDGDRLDELAKETLIQAVFALRYETVKLHELFHESLSLK
jgi:hypothetical protein